jgi:hypothetical protein
LVAFFLIHHPSKQEQIYRKLIEKQEQKKKRLWKNVKLVLVGPLCFLTAPNAKVVVIDNGSGL